MLVYDARDNEINVGDTLLDDRGRLLEVRDTEETILRQKVIYARETTRRAQRMPELVRAYDTLRLNTIEAERVMRLTQRARRDYYDAQIRERSKQEIEARRRYARAVAMNR